MNHDSRSFEDELSSLKADVAVMRSNYVTKPDLQEVRIELKGEIQVLRLEIEKMRVEMQTMRADVHKALHGQTLQMYAFAAILTTVVHFATRAGY